MKSQLFFWAFAILFAHPILSQVQSSKRNIKIKYNPYLLKESIPTDDYSIQTHVVSEAFYGLGGELFVNNHISLNAHLLYRFLDRTNIFPDNGSFSLPVEYRTIRGRAHITELAFSLRFYQQDHRSKVRIYAEAGLGNSITVKATLSKPIHPDPRASSTTHKSYMHYEYLAVLLGGGTQYQFSRRWGGDFQLFTRLPIHDKFLRNIHYGLQFGMIYFLE